MRRLCTVAGCNRHRSGHGLCNLHWMREWREQYRDRARETNRRSTRNTRGARRPIGRCMHCPGTFALRLDGSLYRHESQPGITCTGSGRITTTVTSPRPARPALLEGASA
jgi:hypothetical protein